MKKMKETTLILLVDPYLPNTDLKKQIQFLTEVFWPLAITCAESTERGPWVLSSPNPHLTVVPTHG